ncbi:MAG TPA: glycosyltransferase family 4 protein [Vicinamibacterales bacterium]
MLSGSATLAVAARHALRHLVAFPRPFEPAEQLALALDECGSLSEYVTGFVWSSADGASPLLHAADRVLGRRASAALRRRRAPSLTSSSIHSFPTIDAGRTLAAAVGWRRLEDRLWELDDHRFASLAAQRAVDCDVVHGFEHAALELFRVARARRTKTVLYLSGVHPSFHDDIFDRAYERSPQFKHTIAWRLRERRHRRDARRIAEYDLADAIVVGSSLLKRSLVQHSVPAAKIEIVPLGAAPAAASVHDVGPRSGGLRALFAGKVSFHKGCHVLLDAWRNVTSDPSVLTLAGHSELPSAMVRQRGVEAVGVLSQRELFDVMSRSDVLVLPTLCDSFGLVIAEALMHGVPVLTTANAGAADLIEEGVNGWVVAADDEAALGRRLAWCETHLDLLRAMRRQVSESAGARRTWDVYRADLRNVLARRDLL